MSELFELLSTQSVTSVITLITIIAAVITIILAIKQGRMLYSIRNSISTRHIGKFPENMEGINKLIKKTESSLTIVTDVPAYGLFSNPVKFWEYKNLLGSIVHKNEASIQVRIITYSLGTYKDRLEEQFHVDNKASDDQILAAFKRDKGKWQNFISFYKAKKWLKNNEDFESYDNLFTFLKGQNRKLLTGLNAEHNFSYYEVPWEKERVKLPLSIWISDNRRAIFSFLDYFGEISGEVSFETQDSNVITLLQENSETFIKRARLVELEELSKA